MTFSISTLLTRNLDDVFSENDPARRRTAIDEIFHEDAELRAQRRILWPRRDPAHRDRDEGRFSSLPISAACPV